MKRETLRLILIYIIFILLFLKFGVFPLKESLEEKKKVYLEYAETYFQKKALLEKKKEIIEEVSEKAQENLKEEIPGYIYPKEADPFEIQLKLAEEIKNIAQNKKLEILGFDLLPLSYGKRLTEISLSFRLKGKPKDAIEFLKILEKREKKIFFKELTISESARQVNLNFTLSVFKSEI